MVFAQIISLFLLCLLLIHGTSLIVSSLKYLAQKSRLGAYGITAFLLAFSTSLPELVVGVIASLEGSSQIVLGNIIGSNIADISLVIGGAALFGGILKIKGVVLKRDIFLTFGAGILPLLLLADGFLSREDGIVLLTLYLIFISTFLKSHQQSLSRHALSTSPIHRLLIASTRGNGRRSFLRLLLGIFLLIGSSHFIVQLAEGISSSLNLPILFVGLFVVAVGTSLPELAFELKAVIEGQSEMALGDLLGSVVANSTLILGISAVIRPIVLDHQKLVPYAMSIISFIIIYLLFTYFIHTKKRLERWEGLTLIVIYFIFALVELYK